MNKKVKPFKTYDDLNEKNYKRNAIKDLAKSIFAAGKEITTRSGAIYKIHMDGSLRKIKVKEA